MLRLNEVILSNIIKYLNGRSLNTAAQVCRLWYKVVNIERKKRGPVCIKKSMGDDFDLENSTLNVEKWKNLQKEIIDECTVTPMLHFNFTNNFRLYLDQENEIKTGSPKMRKDYHRTSLFEYDSNNKFIINDNLLDIPTNKEAEKAFKVIIKWAKYQRELDNVQRFVLEELFNLTRKSK